jgi:Protein of unknown function (DUF2795)
MGRESTKHGPARDELLKHETEALRRGPPQRAHVEEWRETEPTGEVPVAGHPGAGHDAEIMLRSELARVLTRDDFPADRDALLARLAGADVPAGLAGRLAQLPAHRRFASVHEVMVALGVNAPERKAR